MRIAGALESAGTMDIYDASININPLLSNGKNPFKAAVPPQKEEEGFAVSSLRQEVLPVGDGKRERLIIGSGKQIPTGFETGLSIQSIPPATMPDPTRDDHALYTFTVNSFRLTETTGSKWDWGKGEVYASIGGTRRTEILKAGDDENKSFSKSLPGTLTLNKGFLSLRTELYDGGNAGGRLNTFAFDLPAAEFQQGKYNKLELEIQDGESSVWVTIERRPIRANEVPRSFQQAYGNDWSRISAAYSKQMALVNRAVADIEHEMFSIGDGSSSLSASQMRSRVLAIKRNIESIDPRLAQRKQLVSAYNELMIKRLQYTTTSEQRTVYPSHFGFGFSSYRSYGCGGRGGFYRGSYYSGPHYYYVDVPVFDPVNAYLITQ